MSLILHDGESLDYGNDVSDVFDTNIGIWWHCDDGKIIEISDFPECIYTRESHNKNKEERYVCLRKNIIGCLYQNKQPYIIHLFFEIKFSITCQR